MRSLLAVAVQNTQEILFVVGFVTLYVGVSSLSRPIANVVAGVLLMALAVYPSLRVSKR